MDTSFIVRLLDEWGSLLAWTKLPVAAKGDGCLYAAVPSSNWTIQAEGRAAVMSFHWADVNSEWRVPAPMLVVAPLVGMPWPPLPLLRVGNPPAQRLPPVTVGSVVAAPPTGRLASSGS